LLWRHSLKPALPQLHLCLLRSIILNGSLSSSVAALQILLTSLLPWCQLLLWHAARWLTYNTLVRRKLSASPFKVLLSPLLSWC